MKKMIVASVIALMVFGGSAWAAEKPNQGKCVSDCVQAFNKSLADKGIDAGKAGSFSQKECLNWCKNEYVSGQGYFWQDGACNQKYAATDPDCPPPPPPTLPGGDILPGGGSLPGGGALPGSLPGGGGMTLLPFGAPCSWGWECQTGFCAFDSGSFQGYCSFPR